MLWTHMTWQDGQRSHLPLPVLQPTPALQNKKNKKWKNSLEEDRWNPSHLKSQKKWYFTAVSRCPRGAKTNDRRPTGLLRRLVFVSNPDPSLLPSKDTPRLSSNLGHKPPYSLLAGYVTCFDRLATFRAVSSSVTKCSESYAKHFVSIWHRGRNYSVDTPLISSYGPSWLTVFQACGWFRPAPLSLLEWFCGTECLLSNFA